MNGGRNYNGPKVEFTALVKLGYMLETLSIPHYSTEKGSENMMGADNQQERPAMPESPETTRQAFAQLSK